jgi:Rho GTPase-activating protein 39
MHRTDFNFKRKVPVGQVMTWQRGQLAAPLLNLARPLHKDAVRTFRAIQRLMGDSEKGAKTAANTHRLEEARWLLGVGLTYGELRDEIYGYILTHLHALQGEYVPWLATDMCVAGDPPSVEELRAIPPRVPLAAHHYLRGPYRCARRALSQASCGHREERPRGKPPTLAEIETASIRLRLGIYIHVHPKLN